MGIQQKSFLSRTVSESSFLDSVEQQYMYVSTSLRTKYRKPGSAYFTATYISLTNQTLSLDQPREFEFESRLRSEEGRLGWPIEVIVADAASGE